MEFVQLQIEDADWGNPAIQSRACYEVARKHGKPVIIMEPVKGGMLASPPGFCRGNSQRSGAGILLAASLGNPFCGDILGRRDHRPVRNEQYGTDER